MQQCFLEDPNERPTFKEIKDKIIHASESLRTVVRDSNDDNNNDETNHPNENNVTYMGIKIDDVKDEEMEGRYLDMKRRNKNLRVRRNLALCDKETVKLSKRLLSASFSNCSPGKYVSLENTFSFDPLSKEIPSSYRNREASQCSSVESTDRYKQYSHGSREEKRFFSYYGIDNLQTQDLVAAQSCNPLYMMGMELSSNDGNVEPSLCSSVESTAKYKQFLSGHGEEKRFFSYYGIDHIEAQDFVTAQSCNPLYMIDHKLVHPSEFDYERYTFQSVKNNLRQTK